MPTSNRPRLLAVATEERVQTSDAAIASSSARATRSLTDTPGPCVEIFGLVSDDRLRRAERPPWPVAQEQVPDPNEIPVRIRIKQPRVAETLQLTFERGPREVRMTMDGVCRVLARAMVAVENAEPAQGEHGHDDESAALKHEPSWTGRLSAAQHPIGRRTQHRR